MQNDVGNSVQDGGPVQTAKIKSYSYAESPSTAFPDWLEEPGLGFDGRADAGVGTAGGARGARRERSGEADAEPYRSEAAPGFAVEEEIGMPGGAGDGGALDGTDQAAGDSKGNSKNEFQDDFGDRMASEHLFQELMAAETAKAEERGRIKGTDVGLVLGREEALRQLKAERERLVAQAAALGKSFAETQEGYLHRLEQESARLALAIAARILRREVQLDPLLLTGAVRVALGQLASSTQVRLRVPARDAPLWAEALARMPGLALRPQVVGEPEMELGECRMETELGLADLGLWAQLKTVERGFFDRLEDQPPASGMADAEPEEESHSSVPAVDMSETSVVAS